MARNPERVLRLAVKGMLPKGPLGRQMLKKLKIHPGPTHPHAAQKPAAPGAGATPARPGRRSARRRIHEVPKPLIQTTGRRKEAVARVRLRPGTGVILCNKRPFENFFPNATHRMIVTEPLRLTQTAEVYDVDCTLTAAG